MQGCGTIDVFGKDHSLLIYAGHYAMLLSTKIYINECTPNINMLLSSSSFDHFLVQICCYFISQSAEG